MSSFDRPTPEFNQQSPLKTLLAKLMSGWSTNNAAGAQSSPYAGAGPGAGAEPNLGALAAPPAPRRGPPAGRPAPGYDEMAMDELSMALSGDQGITEGQNANIDDDTRARALAWALRANP